MNPRTFAIAFAGNWQLITGNLLSFTPLPAGRVRDGTACTARTADAAGVNGLRGEELGGEIDGELGVKIDQMTRDGLTVERGNQADQFFDLIAFGPGRLPLAHRDGNKGRLPLARSDKYV